MEKIKKKKLRKTLIQVCKKSKILKYKQIYDAGDAIKFTPTNPAEKYSKTSMGVKVDDETVTVDKENNYLKRVNYYKAADGI